MIARFVFQRQPSVAHRAQLRPGQVQLGVPVLWAPALGQLHGQRLVSWTLATNFSPSFAHAAIKHVLCTCSLAHRTHSHSQSVTSTLPSLQVQVLDKEWRDLLYELAEKFPKNEFMNFALELCKDKVSALIHSADSH